MQRLVLVVLVSLASAACSRPTTAPTCRSDRDCLGSKVCLAGECRSRPEGQPNRTVSSKGSAPLASAVASASASSSSSAAGASPRIVEALAVLDAWVRAQNQGSIDDYLALYDPQSFTGIRRTADGASVPMGFADWKKERSKMVASKATVAAEQPVATTSKTDPKLGAGVVRVSFVQRWRSSNYADHGPKVLEMSGTPLKIVREELLSSTGGWSDAESSAVVRDGASLVSPIGLQLGGVGKGDSSRGALSLVATDARGTKVVLPLGVYDGVPASVPPEPASEGFLYKANLWWAGAGDDFHVVRDGAGVTVKHRWVQEVPEDAVGTVPDRGPFVDIARLTLPAAAQVVAR